MNEFQWQVLVLSYYGLIYDQQNVITIRNGKITQLPPPWPFLTGAYPGCRWEYCYTLRLGVEPLTLGSKPKTHFQSLHHQLKRVSNQLYLQYFSDYVRTANGVVQHGFVLGIPEINIGSVFQQNFHSIVAIELSCQHDGRATLIVGGVYLVNVLSGEKTSYKNGKSELRTGQIVRKNDLHAVRCQQELIRWNLHLHQFLESTVSRVDFFESYECACCLLSFLHFHWLFSLSARETSPGNRSIYKSTWKEVDSKG